MNAVPLIPKARALPNLDAAPLLRELFQDEFEAVVPSKKLSENIRKSAHRPKKADEEPKPCGSKEFLENHTNRTEDVIQYTENVLEAYTNHKEKLEEIRDVEKHVFETHAHFLKREKAIVQDPALWDLIRLKRQPLLKALDAHYVKKYKLLQGDAGLPPEYEAKSDFRVQRFKEWRKRLDSLNQEDLLLNTCQKKCVVRTSYGSRALQTPKSEKIPRIRPKKYKIPEKPKDIFTTDPKILFFTNYKLGYVYVGDIKLKNTSPNPALFLLKPMSKESPFRVTVKEKVTTAISPGLGFQLIVEFTPKSLDNAAEDIIIVTEDGNRFLIPLIAYLEPPILKTHKEINEFTKVTSEKIASSYIECGSCFTGDSKVIKLNFRCYRGCGEFFVMSLENWSSGLINSVTYDNLLEIPPFRVYPVYFKVEKDQIIDLFVEFTPKHSGMQVENIIIACDNGQIRSLDIIGDAVGWHSYYFSFQDSLLKELSVEEDDDVKVKYYLDFEDTCTNGKVEKVFCVSNNSDMTFEFQWKIREANITSSQEKYLKLSKYQVKIDPENGTFEPKSIWEFLVTITFNNADIGNYRMVLSLYVLNLPYQCIEEDNTVIQPTGLVRNLYSQSLYGEEEASALSPELTSLQGTYESLQESIKSYMEFQNRAQAAPRPDFCRTVCAVTPGLCAKPLKKSKTLFNIGETLEDVEAVASRQMESNSESCTSNREDKLTEMSPQRNEVIWDFVDILVDEVELWVEVVPTRVTLQPSVLQINNPMCVNSCPLYKEVRVINHNRSPVACTWLMPSKFSSSERYSENTKTTSTRFSLLFDKNSLNKVQGNSSDISENPKLCGVTLGQSEEKGFEETEAKEESNFSESCEITIKPSEFIVPGLSETTCKFGIMACQPGRIKEVFWLNVNDGDLQLKLIITGVAVARSIVTSPDILDFGVRKQGTRYVNNFTVTNHCTVPLSWKINLYKFDFREEKFNRCETRGNIKKGKGILAKKGNSETNTYCFDARVPGIKCSLIEVEETNTKIVTMPKHYVLVLGDVKMPKLELSAPRFENAILAPSGIMYIGQKQTRKITLINQGIVETFFTWGYPFGCHCRKLQVEINPKSSRIQQRQKLTINIELTALEEGIVNHCYIPCFFCRSAEPLILSIVGIALNVNVVFEIIDYPMQNHADPRSFLKSPFYHTILRIPWPVKIYNPTLGLKYLTEVDILNMRCHCHEVEEEAARAFGGPKHELHMTASEKSTRSLKSFDMGDTSSHRSKCSLGKHKLSEEDMTSSECPLSALCTIDAKKSDDNSLSVFSYLETTPEVIQFSKSHLEFLNVPFRTPTLRQFVIRNETPIATSFQISVFHYGVSNTPPVGKLEIIKSRVFSHSYDEFQNKLKKEQPLLFEVEPSQGELKGFEAVCINVYCYGNTWGEYRDHLTCQIQGIEPFQLKMFVQVVGQPLYFPIFKTNLTRKATLRFQPLSPIEKGARKQIKVVNRSSIPLSVSWTVFLTKPFPKLGLGEENLSINSSAAFESTHSEEESTQSSKNYIPKNTSEILGETKEISQYSETRVLSKTESSTSRMTKESRKSGLSERKHSSLYSAEEIKSESQFQFPGTLDVHTFQEVHKLTCLCGSDTKGKKTSTTVEMK